MGFLFSNAKGHEMQKEVTFDMLNRLPAWAIKYIETIKRERNTAIVALNDFVDGQTPSPIFYDEWTSTGENRGPSSKRVYVQSRNVEIVHAGVHLQVCLRDNITINWEDENNSTKHVAFVPTSFHAASLISKENMR